MPATRTSALGALAACALACGTPPRTRAVNEPTAAAPGRRTTRRPAEAERRAPAATPPTPGPATATVTSSPTVTAAPLARPSDHLARAPQFVLLGIDATPGSDTAQTFSRRVGDAAEQAGARVTYFVNTQNYLLSPASADDPALSEAERAWIDPEPVIYRRVSYARSLAEIEGRIATTRYLIAHGHEIASHGVHHERGASWTAARWRQEHQIFARFHEGRLSLPPVVGFRAPYLSGCRALDQSLHDEGLLYDASVVERRRMWPGRWLGMRPWVIPVMVARIGRYSPAIFDDAMERCGVNEREVYRGLRAEFDARYAGNRAPVVLSSHEGFVETVYLRLLREVCGLPEVRCATFADLARFMEAHPQLAAYGAHPNEASAPEVRD